MATTGETLWSDLLNRKDDLATIARQADVVQLRVRVAGKDFFEYDRPVRDFVFKERLYAGIPLGSSVKTYLTFTQYRLGNPGVVLLVRIMWPHGWVTTKSGVLNLRLNEIRRKHKIRFLPLPLSGSPGSKPGRPFVIEGKKLTPTKVYNILLGSSSHSVRVPSFRRLSKRVVFPKQMKLRPNPEVSSSTYVQGSESNGSPWSQTTGSYESFRRSYVSVRTPGFGGLRRTRLMENPYTLSLQKTNLGQGLHFWKHRTLNNVFVNRAHASTVIIDNKPPLPDFSPELYSRCVSKLSKRADVEMDNLAQDFVQYRQTTNMIASSATRIALSIKALKSGNISDATKALFHNSHRKDSRQGNPSVSKSLANNWLELQYGWKPLLMDIDGAMRALAHYQQANDYCMTVRASATKESASTWPVEFRNQPAEVGVPIPNPWPSIATGERVFLHSVRMKLRYKQASALKTFASQTGFTSPVNLAWELLPYSFVVDWFLPIGPYLESLSAFEGMTFLDGSVTYFVRHKDYAKVSFNGALAYSPSYDSRVRATYDYEIVSVTREKLLGFPSNNPPQFKNPISTTHALNALALMRAAFR